MQRITMFMDESGLINTNENGSVYGGLVFVNDKDIHAFEMKYVTLIKHIRCGYCKKTKKCDHICPEVKHKNTIHKRKNMQKIRSLLSQTHMFFVAIDTTRIYDSIMEKSASRRTI